MYILYMSVTSECNLDITYDISGKIASMARNMAAVFAGIVRHLSKSTADF